MRVDTAGSPFDAARGVMGTFDLFMKVVKFGAIALGIVLAGLILWAIIKFTMKAFKKK